MARRTQSNLRACFYCFLFSFGLAAGEEFDLAQGPADDPIAALRQRWARTPANARANYDLGFAYFGRGQLREARPFLERATVLAPSDADSWKALGLLLLKLNDYGASVLPLQKACSLGADTCYLESRALFLLRRYDEAVKPLEMAMKVALGSDESKIHRAMAMNFDGLGNAAEAERQFSLAIATFRSASRERDDPRIDYGTFLVRHARAEEALKPLAQALGASPESPRANAEMARALLDLDRPRDALPHLQKAVELDPGSSAIRMQLGKTYLRLGRAAEGERELRRAREDWEKQSQRSSSVR